MPIFRKLLPGEQGQYRDHLLRLDKQDRYARFCGMKSDDSIEDYCRGIDWRFVIIVGCFVDGTLRAVAEVRTDPKVWPGEGELAVSVEPGFQGRGLGKGAVQRVMTMARNRAIRSLTVVCLPGNRRMQAIVRDFDGALRLEEGEAVGRLNLGWPDRTSLLAEAIDISAALLQTMVGGWGPDAVKAPALRLAA
jgi:GNAT superfamily N-acetyltransferase